MKSELDFHLILAYFIIELTIEYDRMSANESKIESKTEIEI